MNIRQSQIGFGAMGTLLLTLALVMPGCDALYSMTGKGMQKPLYEFPIHSRILVMVDTHPASNVPLDVPAQLGQSIIDKLFVQQKKDKKSEFVAQSRLAVMRADAEKFQKMSISDIAKATNADYVLYVDLRLFSIRTVSDNEITQAMAQAVTKVVDRQGTRIYPKDGSSGTPMQVSLTPELTVRATRNTSEDELIDKMATQISQQFVEYDKENNPIMN